ncbi:MAG: hypothetical protein ACJATI_000368 [Halioglobus sp.]|jgi:hypothetical protein
MKKTNLAFHKKQAIQFIFGCLFLLLGVFNAQGQCTLACNGMTNVSLDNTTSNCQAVITVGMVADTSGCISDQLSVIVNDAAGNPIPFATITSAYIGQTLEVIVHDGVSNNSCWGSLYIEDKLPPVLDCNQMPATMDCYNVANFIPIATDNCDNDLTVIKTKPDSVVVNNCDDSSVSDEVLKTVFLYFIAVDDQGLSSEECMFEFTVLRVQNFDSIVRPKSLLVQNDTHLECDSIYNKLPNGLPSPLDLVVDGQPTIYGTGVPSINGIDLYPNSFEDCNLLVTYVDTELPPIGCATKIMRRWDIYEWSCSNPQRDTSLIQMIEIVDNEGPSVSCPMDYTISTNGSSCVSTVILPSIEAYDNCSTQDELTYGVSYSNGPALNTNGGLAQLQLGENTITYTVYDACLNLTSCSYKITVLDNTPPVVICDQNTTVALTSDGCAYVNASVFDDGSYDECTNVTFTVRRMDNGVPCDTDSNCTLEDDEFFDGYVRFCCIDQGADVMVVLRVTDANGNVNDCMVNVEVQDKLAPTISCPAPFSVTCDFGYDLANLSAAFGDYFVSDNCGNIQAQDVIDVSELNQCNIGIATRTISIGEPGSPSYSACTQVITFTPLVKFNGGVEDSQPDTDIVWPEDVLLQGCEDPTGSEYLPANLPVGMQFPLFTEGVCDLVGANYDDQIFPFNNQNGDACFKIIRSWTVIDWCQFFTDSSGATTYPSWTYTQIIKVNDSEGPTDIVTTGPESICTYDSECLDGSIELGASSSDVCTNLLDWSYIIYTDADNDGKLDDILVVDNISQNFSGNGFNTIDASGTYPIGTHKVLYTFSDKCGNITSKEFTFSIVNCKTPSAYCHNGLAVDLMEDGNGGGTVQMWATDLDAGSSHPCNYDVYISFDSIVVSETGNVDAGNGILINVNNGRIFTCDDLGDNPVDVWVGVVTPEGNVIQSYCTASLNVQDNMGICPDGLNLRVEGSIATATDVELQNAEVLLLGSELNVEMTNENGAYAFPLMPMGGTYSVSPLKNDDYVNGVSTLDLVMIQRHVLGLEELSSPYKMIAADINNDEVISASDLLQCRKLILGTITELPNNGSWRFIDANYVFADATDPFAENLPEAYDIDVLNSDMNVNFVAIKVGDINDNVIANLNDQNAATIRSGNTISMKVANQTFDAGNRVVVPVTISEEMIATGLQFTVEVGSALDFAGVNSETINISDDNIGFATLSEGVITLSWNHATGVLLSDNEAVMELVFTATKSGSISKELNISSNMLKAEMYNDDLETMDIEFVIEGREDVLGSEFVLYQNAPNPFTELTNITFELPVSKAGTLTVYNMTGIVVSRIQRTFEKGTNQITLNRADLGAAGVLYYQLEVGEYLASRKMILID